LPQGRKKKNTPTLALLSIFPVGFGTRYLSNPVHHSKKESKNNEKLRKWEQIEEKRMII